MSNYFCRKAVLQFFPGNFSEQEKKTFADINALIRFSIFFRRIFRSEALVYNYYSDMLFFS